MGEGEEGLASLPAGESGDAAACPYLRLADDRGLFCLFPAQRHRCFRGPSARGVDLARQGDLCLGGDFRDCRTYLNPTDRNARQARGAGRSWFGYGLGGIILLLAVAAVPTISGREVPVTPVSPLATTATPSPARTSMALVATIPAATNTVAPPSSTATPAATATLVIPTVAPTPAPTEPPAPAPVPPTDRTPLPTATAAPPPPRNYLVVSSDTLANIAARFDTTIEAIVSANNIKNRNLIFPNQRLVIP